MTSSSYLLLISY